MKYPNVEEKNIVFFGDSNTHGTDTIRDTRFSRDVRYPGVIRRILGDKYNIIEEGLPGRTTVFDDPTKEGLNGLRYINPCLMSHTPVDLLVINLGGNDTKERFGCTAELISRGLERLIKKAKYTEAWRDEPKIIIVCPPPIREDYRELLFGEEMGDGCYEKSLEFPKYYKQVAERQNVLFFNANDYGTYTFQDSDGMHLTAEAHEKLAVNLAKFIEQNLS